MSVIPSFRNVLLMGSSRLSTFRRHCSMLISSRSLYTRKRSVFIATLWSICGGFLSFMYWFRIFWGIGWWERRRVIFREWEKVLGCTHALSNINTPIGYVDGLDESCRTRWLLIEFAQRTGDPKLPVSTVLLNSDAVCCWLLHTPGVNTY